MDLVNAHHTTESPLQQAQAWLKKHNIHAMLVRSCDRYFNEYVPKSLSLRYKLTGFDGSVGDALITQNQAFLYVDGRYTLQAQEQAKGFKIVVATNALSIENSWLNDISQVLPKGGIMAYDPSTVDLMLFEKLGLETKKVNATLNPCFKEIAACLFNSQDSLQPPSRVFLVPENIAGTSVSEKIVMVSSHLKPEGLSGFLFTKLDDCSWLTNIRSYYFPFQSALPGIAALVLDRIIFGVGAGLTEAQKIAPKEVVIVEESAFFQKLSEYMKPGLRLGADFFELSKEHELSLHKHKIEIQKHKNPAQHLKAIKNEKELLHLRSAFKKADQAVFQTHSYVVEAFEKNTPLNESDVDLYIKNAFKRSGAQDLSFRPICASGEHGAIIHYGHPSREKVLAKNSLFLLDCGAYYEGGYATDLTRTFLAGAKNATAESWQKKMFTLVLKASIRGLTARIRRGTTGMQLDAMVRYVLWQAGVDFAHGTGHGVGINVHEFPPRIGPNSTAELLVGHVFSIEPGLYFKDRGGVRIENLATIVADEHDDQFLRVLPLTFCPIDERLIDHDMLDDSDHVFLQYSQEQWLSDAPWPKLPPLPTFSF